ncbi:MAG: hypothetical protein K5988_05840, partial [Lachnospiraceae bacterium]|nr:hypothetical protein [Lachnospiraceae bacterium]
MENKLTDKTNRKKSILPILALIFAFVFPLAGFVLAIISLGEKKDKKEISIAALILSIVVAIVAIVVLIIASPYILGTALLAVIVAAFAADEKEHEKTDPTKELTNYFYESPIVSARYYFRDGGTNTYTYDDIPEDKIDEFVDALNSLTISGSSDFHTDYFYGGVSGIECTLEDGTNFDFDGEKLIYYDINGERKASRFIYFEEDFWKVLGEFNKTICNETTEIEVYGFLDSSDYRDYVYETQDRVYISLNDNLYSEGNQNLVFECEENLGPVIDITDEYILFIQRSEKFEKIKKLDLNSGDIKEECYYEIYKYKEAFLDDEYFFAYNDEEVLCLNINLDEVDYVRNYTVSFDGTIKGAIKDLPEGYFAKQDKYTRFNVQENRLLFYKDTEEGEEKLTFHERDSLELTNTGYSNAEIGLFGDSLYIIDSNRNEFLSEWLKDTLSIAERGVDGYSYSNKETFYEDESNRIIGYNPDNKIVYLYSFENKSISMKNIEDG